MTKQPKPWRIFSSVMLGIVSAMCYVTSQEGYVGMSDLPASSTSLLWSALALVFAGLFVIYSRYALKLQPLHVFAGLFFGVCNAFGGLLFAYDQWDMLLHLPTLVLTILRSIGQGLPMVAVLCLVDTMLRHQMLTKPTKCAVSTRFDPFLRLFEKHTLLVCMGLFFLCWSPYLIVYFPGTVCWDLGEMAAQFFGLREMNTWHPVFLTWIFGGLIWVGRLVGSDNVGAFLYTLLQTACLAYALGKVMVFLQKQRINAVGQLVSLLFFALTPFFGGYAQFISKDTLYVAMLLLFALTVMEVLISFEKGEEKLSKSTVAKLFVYAILPSLIRSNGLYVVLPTAVLLIVFGARKRARWQAVGSLGCAMVIVFLFHNVLIPALGITDATASGIYSVSFQQSARVLRDHPDDVTETEFDEINLVLDAERLPDLYEPWISDPVKYTFRQYGLGVEVETQALQRYSETWLSMLWKYPLDYAESFFAGNISYYTFMPKIEGETYNNQAGNRLVFETYTLGDDPLYVHTNQIEAFETLRTYLAIFARGIRHIPLFGLLYTCAFYTWLLVGGAISLAHQKRWRMLVAYAPALLSLAVCMLSPVNDYFRYFLPIVVMTIPLLAVSKA